MTKENAKQLLPLIEAFINGKIIQGLVISNKIEWIDLNNPRFDAPANQYRIKPEPVIPIKIPFSIKDDLVGTIITEVTYSSNPYSHRLELVIKQGTSGIWVVNNFISYDILMKDYVWKYPFTSTYYCFYRTESDVPCLRPYIPNENITS